MFYFSFLRCQHTFYTHGISNTGVIVKAMIKDFPIYTMVLILSHCYAGASTFYLGALVSVRLWFLDVVREGKSKMFR